MTLLEKLNAIANEYECEVVEGNEFAYYYADSTIVVNTHEEEDVDFLNFARANGLNEEVGCFVISFFHELGHNETLDFVEEYNGNKDELTKEEYFNLEEELEATLWGIDFCNNNLDLVKEIEKLL